MNLNQPIRRRIYEWPDGAWVELDLDPRVSILGAPQPNPVVITVYWRQGNPTHDAVTFELKAFDKDSPGGKRAVMQLSYNDFLTAEQRKKLVGFLIDVGVDDHPSSTTDLLYGARDYRMATYPRWVSEVEWSNRYLDFRGKDFDWRYLGHIRDLRIDPENKLVKIWSTRKVLVSWSTQTRSRSGLLEGVIEIYYPDPKTKEVSAIAPDKDSIFEPDKESALRKACDMLCEKELLLPISAKEEWESFNAEKGKFLIPSQEEVEVFKILDEPLPFFWKEGLTEFLTAR